MNDIFQDPRSAMVVVVLIYLANLYCAILALWTICKLPNEREVARAVCLMILFVGLLPVISGAVDQVQGCTQGPVQISQVIDVLHILINILILRLFLRPCYLDEGRKCRELC